MKRHIICIETEFDFQKDFLEEPFTSEPILQFLQSCNNIKYIYRHVATKNELRFYLNKISAKRFDPYSICYFSAHGNTQGIYLVGEGKRKDNGKNFISIDELADLAGDAFYGKVLHFGSCRTLLGSADAILEFKDRVGATLVSGYRKSVDSVQCAIMDMAYFDLLQNREILGATSVTNSLRRSYSSLMDELGFVIF